MGTRAWQLDGQAVSGWEVAPGLVRARTGPCAAHLYWLGHLAHDLVVVWINRSYEWWKAGTS